MALKSDSDLISDNDNNIVDQTSPESIGPAELGTNVIENIVESKWSRVDDLLLFPPVSKTKAQLAVLIGASGLNNRAAGLSSGQWIQITDRADANPLWVQSQGTSKISPFGIWVKGGVPLAVIMDYNNGFEGETDPFICVFDENQNLKVETPIIIKDGTQADGRVLVSDANGKTTWKPVSSYQSGVISPELLAGGGIPLMAGLAALITPTKTGRVLIVVSGEYVSDTTSADTVFVLKSGTGSAPSTGDALTGTSIQSIERRASSATLRIPFSFNSLYSFTPGTPYWFDIGVGNEGAGNVQLFNVSVSLTEQ